MRLEELVVEGFKKLDGRHVVRPAPAGITVVSGDNEEGKSTLLDALKRAFFMKHNAGGEARDAIQPLGQPLGRNATPAVTVAFRIGAAAFRLEKRFRKGGVRLEGPNGTLEGDAAEHELARLLAFDWPGRGPAKPEHMGLAGLFWVDQGTTFAADQAPSPTALRTLQPALAGEVASVGRGERAARLMKEVQGKHQQFYTPRTGQQRGELAELAQTIATLGAELAQVIAEERAVEDLLDRLAQTLERRRVWLAADQLGRARDAVSRTTQAMSRVQALAEQTRLRAAERQAAEGRLAALVAEDEARARLVAAIADKTAERTKELEAAAEAEPERLAAERRHTAARTAEAEARQALERLEQTGTAIARQAERLALERELAVLERTLQAVRAAATTATEAAALAAADPVTADTLAELERQAGDLGEMRAALRAVATRLVLRPDRSDARVSLDEAPVDPGKALELTVPAVLLLDGFGRIEVTPGGAQLPALHAALHEAETALQAGLAALGAADLATVRRRLAAKERQASDAAAARQRLAELLGASGHADPAALELAVATARTRLAALAHVALPAGADEATTAAAKAQSDADMAAARARLASLGEEREAAAQRVTEFGKAAEHRAFAEARIAAEIARDADTLAIERERLSDAGLAAALARARAAVDDAAETAARLERELARIAPDTAAREAEQAARRLAQLEEEARDFDRKADRLEAEIRGAGGRGIGDKKAELTGRLELARRLHDRRLAEAEAWRLLDATLTATDRARQDALVAPLEARVRPYLQQLLGDAGLGFEPAGLQLDRLERAGNSEPFQHLSIGTREQLAVLVRLAIGDLLAETTGESPPLILDDALVYADAIRLARMKTILETAAERQQIIILTCRKEDYLGLDARWLTLEDCRSET